MGDRREKRRLTLERRLCDLIGEKACRNEKREIRERRKKITSQIKRRKTHTPNREHCTPFLPCGKHQELKLSFSNHLFDKNLTPMTLIHSILRARAMQLFPPCGSPTPGSPFPCEHPQCGSKHILPASHPKASLWEHRAGSPVLRVSPALGRGL